METLGGRITDVDWIAVEDESAPGRVRNAAIAVATRLGFSEHRIGEIAIGATELGTNLHRHAQAGVLLVRTRHEDDEASVEFVAIDAGPGMADLAVRTKDGHSTGGTLGIGLGAIQRLATTVDAYSLPGRGTVIVAAFANGAAGQEKSRVSGLTRPIHGERACGDAWAHRCVGGAVTIMLADGLGHGELAAVASRSAVRAFHTTRAQKPAAILSDINVALRGSRGAAAAVVRIAPDASQLVCAGLGNIAVWVDDGERRNGLACAPGIVGSYSKTIRENTLALPKDPLVVLHSDGLTPKWDLRAYPGIWGHSPDVIAATLLRDAAIRHDDASIVVAKI